MEENTLEESISRLLASIKESAEYIEFEKQKEILSQDPDLKKRVEHSGPKTTGYRASAVQTSFLKW